LKGILRKRLHGTAKGRFRLGSADLAYANFLLLDTSRWSQVAADLADPRAIRPRESPASLDFAS